MPSPEGLAGKFLGKAAKQCVKAGKKIDKKGEAGAKSALSKLRKASLFIIKAGAQILPDDLREDIFGDEKSL